MCLLNKKYYYYVWFFTCAHIQFLRLINLMCLLDKKYYYYVWFFTCAHIQFLRLINLMCLLDKNITIMYDFLPVLIFSFYDINLMCLLDKKYYYHVWFFTCAHIQFFFFYNDLLMVGWFHCLMAYQLFLGYLMPKLFSEKNSSGTI